MNQMNMRNSLRSKSNDFSNTKVVWTNSQLFYIYLNELDMDFKDAYYSENWNMMHKSAKLKYLRVRRYIINHATKDELKTLEDDKDIELKLSDLKSSETDYANRWNNRVVSEIISIIIERIKLISDLMARAGMDVLLSTTDDKPAILGDDDF